MECKVTDIETNSLNLFYTLYESNEVNDRLQFHAEVSKTETS